VAKVEQWGGTLRHSPCNFISNNGHENTKERKYEKKTQKTIETIAESFEIA
jgi:hypothetical protein